MQFVEASFIHIVSWLSVGTRTCSLAVTIAVPLVAPRFNDTGDNVSVDMLLDSSCGADAMVFVGVELEGSSKIADY